MGELNMAKRIMECETCINLVNKLEEFNLITRTQADRIISKRDKQEANVS